MTHNGFLTDGATWDRKGARTAGTQELTITSGRIRGFNAAGEEIRGEMPKGTGDREVGKKGREGLGGEPCEGLKMGLVMLSMSRDTTLPLCLPDTGTFPSDGR
ncbi:hypothetical protein Bpfe_030616 [Biomphalaria pfeifferi]|uniref:Uncharacterized protein n=1 Tax=Biomphalaria pfeifferi TaxID=112525 RepID=A0AAD8AQG0_BIOPF|nr:hypothetical protein Bpfe_030616 [Biomphalaria pfeifferi]